MSSNVQTTKAASSRGLWICIGLSLAVALAAAVRRLAALAHPSAAGPPQMIALDSRIQNHTMLTVGHLVPAIVFVCLVPWVFRRGAFRDTAVRLLYPVGAMVGLTAYAMSGNPVGGWIERSAVLTFDTLFLFSLARAYGYRRGGAARLEMRWLSRAIWVLLGIATTRPVMAIFFATSRISGWRPEQFFGIAFWVGFSINTVGVELWLRSNAFQRQWGGGEPK